MHRFPQDANFALRAGWVALLTGNSERAYKFLLDGKRIGFPSDKLENATALLTIAAAQAGAYRRADRLFRGPARDRSRLGEAGDARHPRLARGIEIHAQAIHAC